MNNNFFKDLLSEENKAFIIKQLEEAKAEADEENSWITFEELKEHLEKRMEEDMKKYELQHKRSIIV